jgi:putative hydrolase of the HAD superfamily
LFIDDVELILEAAQQFGIRHCLGVQNPDSSMPNKTFAHYPAISDYRLLIPALQREIIE